MLERLFKLSAHGTSVQTEIIAGLTTFMTMAYVLFVNPSILAAAGMDKDAVLLATVIGSAVITIMMGLYVNYPIALAPGMGINAFFTYSVVIGMGVTWQIALGAVFLAGIVFIILTVTKFREVLVAAIPNSLKHAITVGIGLFIALLGLKMSGIMSIKLSLSPETIAVLIETNGHLVLHPGESLIQLGQFTPPVLLTLFGLLLTALLMARHIKGAILIGILATAVLGILIGEVSIPQGFRPVSIPDFSHNAFFALDIRGALKLGFVSVILTFVFVALFDAMGTMVGAATKAGLTDENGNIPKLGKAMTVDAIGSSFGALLGTSTVTAYVESAAGVSVGGRTGLTAIVVGVLFLLALFFTPLIHLIPDAATAPALIIVGGLMLESVKKINFGDATEYLPAFVTIIGMPFTYSISNGISFGLVLYPLMKLVTGRWREVHWLMWLLLALVICRFIFLEY